MDPVIFLLFVMVTAIMAVAYSATCALFVHCVRELTCVFGDSFPRPKSFKGLIYELFRIARSVYLYNLVGLILGAGLHRYVHAAVTSFILLCIIPVVKFWSMHRAYLENKNAGAGKKL